MPQQSQGPQKRHREKKGLGKWFKKASLIKHAAYEANEPISIILFYQYVKPKWSDVQKELAKNLLERLGQELNLGGRIRVSVEGLNATVSGTHKDTRTFTDELKKFDKNFNDTDFKFVDNLPTDRAFKDLKVLPVKELVYYGIDNEHTLGLGGKHLHPVDFHTKLQQRKDSTVVIDVRNGYEYDIGRFDGQEKSHGAELLNPEMRKSTDFPAWLALEETQKKLEGKEVLMYCTGGIRCERASSLVRRELGDRVKEIYQLEGGIEKYLQTFKDEKGGFWQGKNFVFDKREAFDVNNMAGVGGILKAASPNDAVRDDDISTEKDQDNKMKKKKKKKRKREDEDSNNTGNEHVLGMCCVCSVKWDRYIGKKMCSTCSCPVLMCSKCCEKKVDKSSELADKLKVRCPLCKKQNCTVLASEVSLKDNGKGVKVDFEGGDDERGDGEGRKTPRGVATTVLKWGGGHSVEKRNKKRRKEEDRKMNYKAIECRFGAECVRKDCWFKHSDRAT